MLGLLTETTLSDMTIVCKTGQFHIHRCILLARLGVFIDTSSLMDCTVVTCCDVDFHDIRSLLRSIYSGEDLTCMCGMLNQIFTGLNYNSVTSSPTVRELQSDVAECTGLGKPNGELLALLLESRLAELSLELNCWQPDGFMGSGFIEPRGKLDGCMANIQLNHSDSNGIHDGSAKCTELSHNDSNTTRSCSLSAAHIDGCERRGSLGSKCESGQTRGLVTCSLLGHELLDLYLSSAGTDVVLLVDDRHFPVHRCILSAWSTYFASMFSGSWRETSQSEIRLIGVSAAALEKALEFIYRGVCDMKLTSLSDINVLLNVADVFDIARFTDVLSMLVKRNWCHFFHQPSSSCGCIAGVISVLLLINDFRLDEMWNAAIKCSLSNVVKVWSCQKFAVLPNHVLARYTSRIATHIGRNINMFELLFKIDHVTTSVSRSRRSEPIFGMAATLTGACTKLSLSI
jgi:hypothetical protein